MPVKAVVPEREPAMVKAATVEDMPASKAAAAAMEHGAAASKPAAMKRRTTTVETTASSVETATTAMETAATMTATAAATMTATAAAAMTTTAATADFRRQPVGNIFRRRHRAWVHQRKRFCALGRRGQQHPHRGGREPQSTDKAASGNWNCHHV